MPGVTVIAEESFAPMPARCRIVFSWSIARRDREFLAGHSDFAVNIALIEAATRSSAPSGAALAQIYVGGAKAFQADLAPGRPSPPGRHESHRHQPFRNRVCAPSPADRI